MCGRFTEDNYVPTAMTEYVPISVTDLTQKNGETTEAHVARLERIKAEGVPLHEQLVLNIELHHARYLLRDRNPNPRAVPLRRVGQWTAGTKPE
jgi:hypothetical protein